MSVFRRMAKSASPGRRRRVGGEDRATFAVLTTPGGAELAAEVDAVVLTQPALTEAAADTRISGSPPKPRPRAGTPMPNSGCDGGGCRFRWVVGRGCAAAENRPVDRSR